MKTKERSYGKVTGSPPYPSIRSFPREPKPGGRSLVVPRPQFIPDTIWESDNGRRGPNLAPLHRDERINQCLQLAAGDDLVIPYVGRQSRPRRPASTTILVGLRLAEMTVRWP